jgi:PAS domain S-box-containing protein
MARADGLEAFQITQRTSQGSLIPAAPREEYFPVYFVEPRKGNEKAVGFDLVSEPMRLEALSRSRDTGQMVATAPVTLVQETEHQAGFLVFVPIYDNGATVDTVGQRRDHLKGFILGVFRAGDLVEEALANLAPAGIDMDLSDSTESPQLYLLHHHVSRASLRLANEPRSASTAPADGLTYQETIGVADRKWSVVCAATPTFLAANTTIYTWGVLGAGLVFTLLVSAYLTSGTRHAARQCQLVRQLSGGNQALGKEVSERKEAEESLRQSEEDLSITLHSIGDAVIATDTAGRVVRMNPVAEQLTGWPLATAAGKPLAEVFHIINARTRQPVADPLEKALATGQVVALGNDTALIARDGAQRLIADSAAPIRDAQGRIRGAVLVFHDVTAEYEVRQAMRQSEERFRILFESSRDAMMTVEPPLWRFTSGNQAAIAMFRAKDLEAFTSYGPWSLSPERQPDGRASNEKAKEMNDIALRDGSHFFEWTHKRLDGEEFPSTVLLTSMQYAGKVIIQSTIRDITQQKRSEQELSQTASLMRSIIDTSTDFIFVKDCNLRTVLCNETYAQAIGKHPSDLHGKTDIENGWDPELVRGDPAKGIRGFELDDRDALNGKTIHNDCDPANVHGDIRVFDTIKLPLHDAGGEIFGVLGVSRDVTKRKRAEEAIRQAKTDAEQANAAKSAFLANMSHEIRTPMTAILGFAEMLDNSIECCTVCAQHQACPTREQNKESIRVIRRNGAHLLSLINDVLDLSKIEAGKMEVEKVPCWPAQLVEEAVSSMRVKAIEKGLFLEARYEFPLPQTILSDPTRVRQILVNLVGNAVKFTSDGHVEIVVRCIRDVRAQRAIMAFDVKDTGIGMTPEQIGRLFQPFAQADCSTTRQYGGTGLGLAISKRLAEALGGDIQVASRPGEGSTFTFTLETDLPAPARMLNDLWEMAPAPHQPQSARAVAARLRGRILLAEDGPDNQKLISMILGKAGAEVDVASNGRIAAEMALAAMSAGTPYDAILMDMQMPEMDGYAATRQLRGAGYPGPIVALTAHAMFSNRQKCLAAGCDDYATKPIDRVSLLAILARLMGCPQCDPQDAPAAAPGKPASEEAIHSAFHDDPDMAGIIAQFVGQLPQRLGDMRQAAANNQWDVLHRLAHQLKGAGGSYGYACLTDAARELESHARQQDGEAARLALNNMARLCQRIQAGHAAESVPRDESKT